ncbi:hypothetical protein BCCR75502_02728 [Burkholderia sola]|nr:hypothetical protein BCCR75389_02714 [Burkholderia cenocepacia]CAG2290652.1 hypothetical protein BCCR75386_02726 [Burkholderia cenocepacia]CAG2291098.1 hypothetical protein BCCR75388_02730 [Burkholderia cenocepacia]CAG2291192.1 hypothetical protein BCCR75384_02727 [Burkholderia cenocepacia]CAG2291296.1 hypothetical protein BCCR75387_02726 [Burkholderia cenocepacia]
MRIAVVWRVRLVGLLDPERHRLRDQFLEFDVVGYRHGIDGELEMAPEPRPARDPLWQQDVRTERGIQLDEARVLDRSGQQRAS